MRDSFAVVQRLWSCTVQMTGVGTGGGVDGTGTEILVERSDRDVRIARLGSQTLGYWVKIATLASRVERTNKNEAEWTTLCVRC